MEFSGRFAENLHTLPMFCFVFDKAPPSCVIDFFIKIINLNK